METARTDSIRGRAFARVLSVCSAKLVALWRTQRKRRSLLVKETLGLGERRFVAVIQFERQRFLIGGSPGSVTLLSCLADDETLGEER